MSSKNNRGRNLPEGWTSNISKKSRPGHRYYTHKNGRKQWGSPVNNIKNRVGGDESCIGCTPGSRPQSLVEQARAALKAELERQRQAEELERQRQATGNQPCIGCTPGSRPQSLVEQARAALKAELERQRQAAEAAGSNTTKKTESGGRRRKTKKNHQRRR